MLINKKLLFTITTGLILGIMSCKKYLNVNTNPNVSQAASVKTLLPAAELYLASGLGVDLQINGAFWAQYWTQAPTGTQYQPLDQYAPSHTISTDYYANSWTNLYAAGENLRQLYILADTEHKKQYMAISLLLKAYTFQLLTDAWGDVPFKYALQGQFTNDTNGGKISPKFDSQLVVYKGIIALIDSANAIIDPSDPAGAGADDIIYGGNMSKWQKFSNTLQLRVLLRMSNIDPIYAQTNITALYASSSALFIGAGDDALINFGGTTGTVNPLYSEASGIGKQQNFAASFTIVDSMRSNYDTCRWKVFFEKGSAGNYAGIHQGDFNTTTVSYSIPSFYVGGDVSNSTSGSAPVILMSATESYFLQAEAAALGYGTGVDSSLFYRAIQANFDFYNSQIFATSGINSTTAFNNYVSGTGIGYWALYPVGGSVAQKIRFIITQKWFAMCGTQSFEAWTEWRRTGYPDFLQYSINSSIGAQFPKRFLYPIAESATNPKFPGLAPITNKVWWDIY